MAEEYYIRQPDAEEARGPFTVDKLLSLVEAEQIDNETLYFVEETEDWVPVSSNEALRRELFPEKKKLNLKPKTAGDMNLLNVEEDDDPGVSVDEMLAAAEGDTEETRHVKNRIRMQEKAAALSLPVLGVIMLISAFINIFPNISVINLVINEEEFGLLLQSPLLMAGLLDFLLGVFLLLAVAEIFPILRFRAMLGFGYYGFFHWAQWYNGDPNSLYLMASSMAASLGIFICTLTLNLYLMVTFSLVGIGGLGGYAYLLFAGG